MGYAGYSAPNAFFSKIPYLGRSQRGWQDLDRGGSPPMYEGPKSGIYSMVDGQRMMPPPSRQGPSSLPQLDTNVSYSNVQPFSASSRETYSSRSLQSPQSGATNIVQYAQSQQQQQQQMPPAAQFRLPTNISPVSQSTNRFMISENATYDPNNAAQYGAGTMQTFNTTSSDRSRMPDPVYNQSELARQASTAYNPNQRAVNRASELSSISSGFGDGDIIMPPPAVLQQNMDPTTYNYGKPRDGAIQSIDVNAPDVNDAQARRDTVYTTTSEDRPARYRSVNSWVDQQTGRVQRHQDDAPPVPALPAEDRYTMMMDDEEPRRVDEAMPQPPVPSLPFTTNVNSTTTTE
ncbi:hypothetical protein BD289DRAFT_96330 [Coniella lustricola]|uniref:Uncharacterized protein n=1 Tax=Coniella lustricola TaxID=2025994 RepID=A0A2T3AMR7_9PEZI|nr:hypothetical protein BD289DRAFT_96330 [Coniella lustricola]